MFVATLVVTYSETDSVQFEDESLCDYAVPLSNYGMLITLLKYSIVSSNKFEYINL